MAWTERRGKKTLVVWREPDGQRRSKSFPTSAAARTYKAEVELKLLGGTYVPESERKQLVGDYALQMVSTDLQLRESSRRTQEGWVCRHIVEDPIGMVQLGAVRPQDVRLLLGRMREQGLGDPTIQKVRMILGKVLNRAVREGIIGSNPVSQVPAPKPARRQVRILSPQEVAEVSEAIEPRYGALVLLAAYGGLRIGELAALRVENLDLLRHRVTVVEAISGDGSHLETHDPKTDAGRRAVTLPGFVCEALAAHLAAYPAAPDGRVFQTGGGRHVTSTMIRRPWKAALRAVGLPQETHFHDLRHTSVALAIQQGAHPKEIQMRVGHANISTTMDTYGHLFEGTDDALAERMQAAYGGQEEGTVVKFPATTPWEESRG
jgi:integrase